MFSYEKSIASNNYISIKIASLASLQFFCKLSFILSEMLSLYIHATQKIFYLKNIKDYIIEQHNECFFIVMWIVNICEYISEQLVIKTNSMTDDS